MNRTSNYTVALSFASEDNEYVEQFAQLLRIQGMHPFFYKYEESNAWGKTLSEHLTTTYRDKSDYVIIFLSKHYKEKYWTSHELKAAQERASVENKEYILPVSLDGTQIPEIPPEIAYICLINKRPEYLLSKFQEKLLFDQQSRNLLPQNNENDRRWLELIFSGIEFNVLHLYIKTAPKFVDYKFLRAVDYFYPIISSYTFDIKNQVLKGKLLRFFDSWLNLSELIGPLNNSYDLLEPECNQLIYRSCRSNREEYELLEIKFSEFKRYCSEFIQEVRQQHPEIDVFSLSNKARNFYQT